MVLKDATKINFLLLSIFKIIFFKKYNIYLLYKMLAFQQSLDF